MNVSHYQYCVQIVGSRAKCTALSANAIYNPQSFNLLNLLSYMGDIFDLEGLFSYSEIELPIPFVSFPVSKAILISEVLKLGR